MTNLRQHLTHAQRIATKEADERRHFESEATAALDAQRATSLLEQSKLRSSLEKIAQTTHERILREREDTIKSETEARHAAGIEAMQKHIASLEL